LLDTVDHNYICVNGVLYTHMNDIVLKTVFPFNQHFKLITKVVLIIMEVDIGH